jgi:hypothetical protein
MDAASVHSSGAGAAGARTTASGGVIGNGRQRGDADNERCSKREGFT